MSLLNQREILWQETKHAAKHNYFMGTYFFTTLFDKDTDGNIRAGWDPTIKATPQHLKGIPFDDLDCLYAPVQDGNNHWQLVIVSVAEKKIQAINPLHCTSPYGCEMARFPNDSQAAAKEH
jgi:hypothetical protein